MSRDICVGNSIHDCPCEWCVLGSKLKLLDPRLFAKLLAIAEGFVKLHEGEWEPRDAHLARLALASAAGEERN